MERASFVGHVPLAPTATTMPSTRTLALGVGAVAAIGTTIYLLRKRAQKAPVNPPPTASAPPAAQPKAAEPKASGLTESFLAEHGYLKN